MYRNGSKPMRLHDFAQLGDECECKAQRLLERGALVWGVFSGERLHPPAHLAGVGLQVPGC